MKNLRFIIPGLVLGFTAPLATAAVPAAYTTAIEGVVTDGSTMATAAFVALIGFAVICVLGALALRMTKKAKSAA